MDISKVEPSSLVCSFQHGQILACDLLFAIRLAIWEENKSDDVVRTAVCRGYHSDVDALSQITATCSAPMPRVSPFNYLYGSGLNKDIVLLLAAVASQSLFEHHERFQST